MFRNPSFRCLPVYTIAISLQISDFALAQDAFPIPICTECSAFFDASVVIAGEPYAVDGFGVSSVVGAMAADISVTVTYPCPDQPTIQEDNTLAYWLTGCDLTSSLSHASILTLGDGQLLRFPSMLETFVDGYTSVGMITYGFECLLLSKIVKLETPFVIGGSAASETIGPLTYTEGLLWTSTSTTLVSEVVLDVSIVHSIGFSCVTPTAWLEAATSTQASASHASASQASTLTLLPDSTTDFSGAGSSGSARYVVGIIFGAGLFVLLGSLGCFIYQRRHHNIKHDNDYIISNAEEKTLAKDSSRGNYSRFSTTTKRQTWLVPGASQQNRGIWRAPMLMLCGLLCGSVFAIGHHFLYESLDGRPVTDFQTTQTWFLRIGNLFAVLVKLSFAISIGVAFVQLQWRNFHRFDLSVREIDALSGVLTSVLSFSDGLVWWRFPSLLILASVFWSASIIPILTPGTLNVGPALFENITYFQVPQIDFSADGTQWLQSLTTPGGDGSQQATAEVQRIAFGTAVGGQILPVSSYRPDGFSVLNFHGPALRCYNASDSVANAFNYAYTNYTGTGNVASSKFLYISTAELPSMAAGQSESQFPVYLDGSSFDYSRIYIWKRETPIVSIQHPFSVIECGLFNAAYSIQFRFQGSSQDISVLSIDYLEGVSVQQVVKNVFDATISPDFNSYFEKLNQRQSYLGLMAGLGFVLVGDIPTGNSYTNASSEFTAVEFLNFDYLTLSTDMLQSKIEELFQNITFSMFSAPNFLKNASNADWVKVTEEIPLTSYVYSSLDLIITYGIAFIVTQICVVFGLYAVMKNSGSYQNRYSTFLRATKNAAELGKFSKDDTAADPRPKALAAASVKISSASSQHGPAVPLKNYPLLSGGATRRKPVPRADVEASEDL